MYFQLTVTFNAWKYATSSIENLVVMTLVVFGQLEPARNLRLESTVHFPNSMEAIVELQTRVKNF